MYDKWLKYKAEEVLTDKDKNGNRLISSFASDYKRVFNQDVCPSCKDFKIKFQKFIKQIQIMKNQDKKNSGFVLKKMYQNIPLGFGSSVYVNNDNMTDEYGAELLENHPRGEELFSHIPEEKEEVILPENIQKLIDDNTKNELIAIATDLGIEDPKGNKTQLAELIVAKQS